MKKCISCQNEILSKAQQCRHCGATQRRDDDATGYHVVSTPTVDPSMDLLNPSNPISPLFDSSLSPSYDPGPSMDQSSFGDSGASSGGGGGSDY